jgi:hypothetical protein
MFLCDPVHPGIASPQLIACSLTYQSMAGLLVALSFGYTMTKHQ